MLAALPCKHRRTFRSCSARAFAMNPAHAASSMLRSEPGGSARGYCKGLLHPGPWVSHLSLCGSPACCTYSEMKYLPSMRDEK